MSSAPSGNDSGQWEKNYESVCALGIVHGGWEEDMKKENYGSSVFPKVFSGVWVYAYLERGQVWHVFLVHGLQ